MTPLYINKEEVAKSLPMQTCIGLMEQAFRSLAAGEALQPLRSIMRLPEKTGGLGMMPAYTADKKMMGIKVISFFPENRKFGYSSHQGVVLLFESAHGELLAIVDADEITAVRTAAASGFATKLLARDTASTLAILGSGTQARTHIEAMLCVRNINSIRIWSRDYPGAQELAVQASKKYKVPAVAFHDAKDAVVDADIICTVTASPTPIVSGDWIKKGAHINAVGSCTPNSREFDTAAIVKAKLYTDTYESLFNEAGDFLIPKKEGAIGNDHVKGELGEVLKGTKKGRESDDEITFFKSLGIAIEDVYAADHVYRAVVQRRQTS